MQAEVTIRVFAYDHELRAWLVDELALMSSTIAVQTTTVLDGGTANLLIVGLDSLQPVDVARLGGLLARRAVPVIGIGAPADSLLAAAFVSLLDAKLTSRQLKRAVRDSLAAPQR